jgi:CheY-like chemotaxis protein
MLFYKTRTYFVTFDVLLTDIEMPGRSVLELEAWLQQQTDQGL